MILFIEFNLEEVGSEGQGHVWRPDVESDDEMEQVQDVWGERKYLCDTYKYFLKSSIYFQLRTLRVIMKIINELTIFVFLFLTIKCCYMSLWYNQTKF